MSTWTTAGRTTGHKVASGVTRRVPAVVEAYRLLRNPSWQWGIARDLARTWREAEPVRAMRPGARGSALVALYRDNIYETKLGLLLGSTLRLEGLEPVVATPRPNTRTRAYARCFGVRRIVVREDVALDEAELSACDRAVAEVRSLDPEVDAVRRWSFGGYAAGYHLLSTLIRLTLDGAPDLHDPETRELLEIVAGEIVRNYQRAERILDDLEPVVVLVEEANYGVNGPLVDVAVRRGVDVVQTIATWRDDALMSKRLTATTRRVDAKSVAPETLVYLEEEPWTEVEEQQLWGDFQRRYGGFWVLGQQSQPGTTDHTPEEVASALDLDPARPTAVVFAHVLWDATLFFGVDLFEHYGDWLVQTVGAAVENPAVNWVVKAHPSNVFRAQHGDVGPESGETVLLTEHYPELPGHVQVLPSDTPISTRSLYQAADYGVTVRGTAGLEMACFGRPVLTAGTGNYSGLGFTHDSGSVREYLDRLGVLQTYPPLSEAATKRAKRYAHALFVRRPWVTEGFALSFDFPDSGWHPLDRNVRVRPPLSRAWAEWVVRDDAPDHLAGAAVPPLAVRTAPGR